MISLQVFDRPCVDENIDFDAKLSSTYCSMSPSAMCSAACASRARNSPQRTAFAISTAALHTLFGVSSVSVCLSQWLMHSMILLSSRCTNESKYHSSAPLFTSVKSDSSSTM